MVYGLWLYIEIKVMKIGNELFLYLKKIFSNLEISERNMT